MACDKTVYVLHNSISPESSIDQSDVLVQADAVCSALTSLGYTFTRQEVFSDLEGMLCRLKEAKPVLVFNLVEEVSGECKLSYIVPSLLEARGIKYTGCSAEALLLTTNKLTAKKLLSSDGIATPPWISLDEEHGFTSGERYIIKPVYEDGSVGLSQNSVFTINSVSEAVKLLKKETAHTGYKMFAEKYIDGREISISILGGGLEPTILQPGEIKFIGYEESDRVKICDYNAKWKEGSFEYTNTLSVNSFDSEDKVILETLSRIAAHCWKRFGLKGYARVDFRVDSAGHYWVLEINANPCIAPGSGFVRAAESSGISYNKIIDMLVMTAINE